MIDIHSHIMPEIDDGARSLEESLEMARVAAEDGIEYIVSTPHMFNGLSSNPEPSEIVDRVAALNAAIGKNGPQILPVNEVHISHEIVEQAKSNRITRINQRNYMLVEFPQFSIPVGSDELFARLIAEGIRPILVHPERNAQIQINPPTIVKLIELGVLVQCTAMSVTGEFGPGAKLCADALLRHDCIHFLATDAHRTKSRPPILSRARAIENQCFLASSNCVGVNRGRQFCGHSVVVDPWGTILASGGDEECLVAAEVDLAAVEEARQRFPAFTDRRLPV